MDAAWAIEALGKSGSINLHMRQMLALEFMNKGAQPSYVALLFNLSNRWCRKEFEILGGSTERGRPKGHYEFYRSTLKAAHASMFLNVHSSTVSQYVQNAKSNAARQQVVSLLPISHATYVDIMDGYDDLSFDDAVRVSIAAMDGHIIPHRCEVCERVNWTLVTGHRFMQCPYHRAPVTDTNIELHAKEIHLEQLKRVSESMSCTDEQLEIVSPIR